MTLAVAAHRRAPGDRTAGALAVAGLVIAFSLSSTLAKRAHTPGVLLAFWRLVTVSVAWNLLRRGTGRSLTAVQARRAVVPGIFLGLNLAAFFAGATHNSVANAALIGSLSPFLIVPIGARLFGERLHAPALLFALVAFAGVVVVLTSAPVAGDATARGNLFGVVAMVLWTGYVVSARQFRQDMDVITFMSTVSPIAAAAVLPLAVADGGLFEMSATGWRYMLLLAFLTGFAAHGLMVFAQRTVPIGTIGIVGVVQPALAVVWSFLLLDERVRGWQAVGIAVAMLGLLAFLVANERAVRVG